MVTGLVSPLLAPQSGEHAGWRWRGGQAMIPVLLAQTDQTFTMVWYHADARSSCEFGPNICLSAANAI